jgi:hypothetical protein
MHCGIGDVPKVGVASALEMDQPLDLLGLISKLGRHPPPELLGQFVELFGPPRHLFRVLDAGWSRNRKVARNRVGARGNREAG